MKPGFLNYLKKKGLTDVDSVNTVFVSAYIRTHQWMVNRNPVLLKYLAPRNGVEEFSKQFANEDEVLTLEDLTRSFEFVVSPADRIVTGAVYTPREVRRKIVQRVLEDKSAEELACLRVADISCGCGSFLLDVASLIHEKTSKSYANIFKENIFGIDIQDYAIERTRILLSLLALSAGEDDVFEFNLLCRDSLEFIQEDWDAHYVGFDVIVGNPPYVCSRHLSEETQCKLRNYDSCSSGHPDLYIPFFQIATEMLNDNGCLGYITMNSFLRSINGRAIRRFFSRNRFCISIVDFRGHQVFASKNTYTCLFFLDKQHRSEVVNYAVDSNGIFPQAYTFKAIPYVELDDDRGWTLNSFESALALETIGSQIKDYCMSRHGIATLSNETYIFPPVAEDDKYYYLENAGITYPIEKGLCRDIVNPNTLNAEVDPSLSLEKVVFPYHIESGKAIIYEPDEMSRLFPMAYAYLNMKKSVLLTRDKNKTSEYPQWYAFGRTQSLVLPRYKLFFPKFANRPLRCVICDDPDLMLYNGLAFINSDIKKLRILKSIIESQLFWDYVQANGKPYASGFYSLSGVDIKHFGIPSFSEEEEAELLSIKDRNARELWLRQKYGLD